MYVSPFHGVDGSYRVHASAPDERTGRLEVAVGLRTDDGATFTATLEGERVPAGQRRLAAALVGLRDSALIRAHGVVLWLRRLPVRPRPDHHQEGVR